MKAICEDLTMTPTDNIERAIEEALEAFEIAEVWLLNCIPTINIEGPKPLPAIRAARIRLQALRSDASRESAWRPIERAPRDGTDVLLYWHYYYHSDKNRTEGYTVGNWEDGKWHTVCNDAPNCITHWQPLPPPPDAGGEG